ncbi:helix-hairpin-helix domain-containing protein [Staphylococcus sp. 11261D007BR]
MENKEENQLIESQLISSDEEKNESLNRKDEQPMKVVVDIKGAVRKPNIYTMMSDDRVQQVVEKADPLPDADLSQVNLAEKLTDQKLIWIPSKNDQLVQTAPTNGQGNSGDDMTQPINLNTAEESDLTEIPGIGPSKAQMILDYREEHGQFKSLEELKEVKGIGDKTFENLKDYFVV